MSSPALQDATQGTDFASFPPSLAVLQVTSPHLTCFTRHSERQTKAVFTTAADDRAAQLQLRTRDSTTETPFLTLDFSAGTADDIIRHLSSELRSLQLRFTDAVASGETSTAEVERQRQTIQHLSESTAKPPSAAKRPAQTQLAAATPCRYSCNFPPPPPKTDASVAAANAEHRAELSRVAEENTRTLADIKASHATELRTVEGQARAQLEAAQKAAADQVCGRDARCSPCCVMPGFTLMAARPMMTQAAQSDARISSLTHETNQLQQALRQVQGQLQEERTNMEDTRKALEHAQRQLAHAETASR